MVQAIFERVWLPPILSFAFKPPQSPWLINDAEADQVGLDSSATNEPTSSKPAIRIKKNRARIDTPLVVTKEKSERGASGFGSTGIM